MNSTNEAGDIELRLESLSRIALASRYSDDLVDPVGLLQRKFELPEVGGVRLDLDALREASRPTLIEQFLWSVRGWSREQQRRFVAWSVLCTAVFFGTFSWLLIEVVLGRTHATAIGVPTLMAVFATLGTAALVFSMLVLKAVHLNEEEQSNGFSSDSLRHRGADDV